MNEREFQGELVAGMMEMDWDEEETLFHIVATDPGFCEEAGETVVRAIHKVHHMFEADPEAHYAAA